MNADTEPRATPPTPDGPRPRVPLPSEPYYRRGDQSRLWGGILLLIGVVWLVFALGSRSPLPGVGLVERSETVPPQSFTADRVVITGANDNVTLVGGEGEAVQVEAVTHGFGWNADDAEEALGQLEIAMEASGDTLIIEIQRPPFSGVGRSPYADLRVALPAGVSAEARLASGDISVSEVTGDLALATVSGRLDARDTSGALSASTASGELEIQSHTGSLTAESVSGDIAIDGVLESPSVKTVSGDVRLAGSTGSVTLSSISGELSLKGAEQAILDIESTSGDIQAAAGLADRSSSRISNISGDVWVELDSADNLALDVTTTSGDLETNLGSASEERRSIRASQGTGSTTLTISTTSGDVEVSANDE